jgi:2-polyprenyl-3-methyl-5-hydroxy-6-metoxy-1,4-benzoquinol methylase
MLITDDYRKEQEQLHQNPNYGVASESFAPIVAGIINKTGVDNILDYGAGKGRLMQSLQRCDIQHKFRVEHYDPAIPEWSDEPSPRDLVCCIDVLEHIEPNLIDDVLNHLQEKVLHMGFFTIHTGPAVKTLSDGRNAHLIQEDESWWLPKIMERFSLMHYNKTRDGFYVMVGLKNGTR